MARFLKATTATPIVVMASAVLATAVAWLWLAGSAPAHVHAGPVSVATFGVTVVMWQAMMVAMMTPTVAPWIGAYARLVGDAPPAHGAAASASFVAGYFAIWLVYSLAAAVLQVGLVGLGALGHLSAPPLLAGGILMVAGLFQFTPVKQACLTHCRNPLSYLIAHWRGGPPGGFRLGVIHGAFCVGCCWLLMLTGFAMGLMNLAWMAVLTVMLGVEQVAPGGVWLGRLFGAALIAWGVGLWWLA